MINSLLERKIEKRPDKVRLKGRILFLTEDAELIKRQLAGEDLPWDTKNPANNPKLRDDISPSANSETVGKRCCGWTRAKARK